jgi:hypothetical protein
VIAGDLDLVGDHCRSRHGFSDSMLQESRRLPAEEQP